MGFWEQMLGMETAPPPPQYSRSLAGLGPRGSATAAPVVDPTAMQALIDSPIGSLLKIAQADVPGKLESGLKAVGNSYKKAIDTGMSLAPTVMSGTAPPEAVERHNRANLELVADMAATGFGSEVPKGALRMFGGRSAKTFRSDVHEAAKKMEANGATRDEIWAATRKMGQPQYKDLDGQWKFEIDDSGATVGPDVAKMRHSGFDNMRPLPGMLDHPELYKAYPDMRDVEVYKGAWEGPSGSMQGTHMMNISPDNLTQGMDARAKSVMLHEGDHGIQAREGHGMGGNTDGPYQSGELDAIISEIYNKIKDHPGNKGESKAALVKHAKKLANSEEWRDKQYRRLLGEANARNTQTRMDYDAQKRGEVPPWETLDVPEDELIVRVGGGGKSMSESRAKVGGELGVNGFNYKGGQFLPSTEAPPGTWRVKKGKRSTTISGGQELVEPGKMENKPTPFSRSLMQLMGSGGEVYGGKAHMLDNPGYWNYMGGDAPNKLRYKDLAESTSEYTVQDLVNMYNKGMRWIELDPVDGVEIVARGIKK